VGGVASAPPFHDDGLAIACDAMVVGGAGVPTVFFGVERVLS
jgi:hypothetical protein